MQYGKEEIWPAVSCQFWISVSQLLIQGTTVSSEISESLWNSCKEGWLVFWAGGKRRELFSCFYIFSKSFLHAGKINTNKNKSSNWAIKLQPNFCLIATATLYGLTAQYNCQIVFNEVRCLFGLKKVERHPLDDRYLADNNMEDKWKMRISEGQSKMMR